ncbi:hypothetical protein XA68_15310 [Ophiocordyceps unilateralis]|uniref:Uncharacterized protein n=1 Tax=Ophiocordyceps unilateralis TaxID=268505 RepID=A0A2A9P8N0_OPHUN|nr:hypothetical protein XA68_15310 [Ophiocordyceps unilateralis]
MVTSGSYGSAMDKEEPAPQIGIRIVIVIENRDGVGRASESRQDISRLGGKRRWMHDIVQRNGGGGWMGFESRGLVRLKKERPVSRTHVGSDETDFFGD